MTIKIKYNVYFRTACIALFSLIFTSCTKDKLEEFDPGNATGKMVMGQPECQPSSCCRANVCERVCSYQAIF